MLKKNMQVLKKCNKELYEKIKKANIENSLEVFKARNGSPSLKIKNEEGDLFIHSKYNPEKEAKRFVSNIDFEGIDAISILGCGLGYHILEIYKKIKGKNIKFFIIESNNAIFYNTLKYQDLSSLFEDDNCYFIVEDNKSEIDVFEYVALSLEDTFFKELIILEWKPLLRVYKSYYKKVKNQLLELAEHLYTNQNTLVHFAKEWNENILMNMEDILVDPGFNFFVNLYKGIPIVIVAAGPSLDKNIDLLTKIKNKAVIITVSNALRSLLEKSIIPDFVVVSDSSKVLEKHIPNSKRKELVNVVLAYDPIVYPQIISDWPGPKIVSSPAKTDVLLNWIEQFTDYKGRIFFGGSVAHAAFSLAYYFGGDPIIFVGQDLALSDGYTHVTGSYARQTIEDNKIEMTEKKMNNKYLEIEDIYGDTVLTREDYYRYLKWLNRTIDKIKKVKPNLKIIDSTEGGAKIENTNIMKLKNVIKEYCNKEYNIRKKLFNKLNQYEVEIDKNIVNKIKNIMNELNYLVNLTENGLNIIDKTIDEIYSTAIIKESKKSIKKINEEIEILTENLIFFEFEFYDTFTKRTNKKFNKHLNRDSNIDNDLYLNLLTDYYNRIKKGSKKIKKIFRNTIINLEKEILR